MDLRCPANTVEEGGVKLVGLKEGGGGKLLELACGSGEMMGERGAGDSDRSFGLSFSFSLSSSFISGSASGVDRRVGEMGRGGELGRKFSSLEWRRVKRAGWEGGRAREDSLEDAEIKDGDGGERSAGSVGEGGLESERGVVGGEGITTDRVGGDLERVGSVRGTTVGFGGEEGGEMERGGGEGRNVGRLLGGDGGD